VWFAAIWLVDSEADKLAGSVAVIADKAVIKLFSMDDQQQQQQLQVQSTANL